MGKKNQIARDAHAEFVVEEQPFRGQLDAWYIALEESFRTSSDDAMFVEKELMLINNDDPDLLPFKKQIPKDYNYALSMFKNLELTCLQNEKSDLAAVLRTLHCAIEAEAANVETKHLPLLTELMIRVMYKLERPDTEIQQQGRNDRRGLALSKEISSFKWGKLIGGLGMLVLGGVLVAGAVLTLMASFGAAAPLSAVLIGLGVHAATPAAITAIVGVTSATTLTGGVVAGGVAVGAAAVGTHAGAGAVIGVRDIYTSLRDKFSSRAHNKVIKQTVDRLFKPAPEEKPSPVLVPPGNSPSSKSSKSGGG